MIFIEFYSKIRKNSLQAFWNDCLIDKPEILELSFDDYFESPDDKVVNGLPVPNPGLETAKSANKETFEDGLNADDDEAAVTAGDESQLEFLNLRRGLGTHDYIGQRVHQIASILRNLSFLEENLATLVKNRSLLRFLVMLSNIRWGNLHHMGLDMLGNIAPEVELSDPSSDDLTRCLLSTISDGLESQDRGVVISCLEVLNKLCQKECNEDYLNKCLDKKVYTQICLFLSLNDIMLLLYTLECIFALTSLGEKSCLTIVQIKGVIDSLVSLVTVEAQSYGPDGCILMRVVETVPTNATPIVAAQSHNQTFSNHNSNSSLQTLTTIQPQSPHHSEPITSNTLTTFTTSEPQSNFLLLFL